MAAVVFVAAAVGGLSLFPRLTDAATALLLLLAVFLTAWLGESGPGVVAALLATLALNFFFMQPVHTLTVEDPRNVVALFVFLVAAVVIGRLSAVGRLRLRLLEGERRDLSALAQLSRSFLSDTNREALIGLLADRVRQALEADTAAILLPSESGRLGVAASAGDRPFREDLAEIAYRQGSSASLPSSSGGIDLYLPIPLGVSRVGALTAVGVRRGEPLAEGCATLIGLAIERERFWKAAQDAAIARARDETKSAMLAAVAHDLKTPVAIARLAAESWRSQVGDDANAPAVVDALKRLDRRIEELLQVVRVEAGAAPPHRERVPASAIVEAAVARFGAALDRHGLIVEIDPADPRIEVDPAQVTEALGLAIENAARYSPPASAVRISVARSGGRARILVEDEGPGVAPEDRERAFQKFVRLPSAAGSEGSGLGLYIARSLAEANGGLAALKERRGGGAAFELAFPEAVA